MLKKIIYYIIIYFLFLNLSTTIAKIYDEFEGGISQDWMTNGWTIDNQNKIIGNDSIISDLNDNDLATSISRTVEGPCEIKFKWKISGGKNNLVFYDNDNPTGYKLPSSINEPEMHANVDWKNVPYNISDCSEHRIKFVHKKYGEWHITCSAWIDGMCVTSHKSSIRFKNAKVIPNQGFSQQEKDEDSLKIIPYNYSVDVETELPSTKIELFTLSPDIDNNQPVSRGTKNVSIGRNRIFWDVILNSTARGNGTYWFVSNYNCSSCKYSGPNIVTYINGTNFSRSNVNNSETMSACLYLETCTSGNAALLYSYDNSDNFSTWDGYDCTKRHNRISQ